MLFQLAAIARVAKSGYKDCGPPYQIEQETSSMRRLPMVFITILAAAAAASQPGDGDHPSPSPSARHDEKVAEAWARAAEPRPRRPLGDRPTAEPRKVRLPLDLDRGICIDRQFRTIPPEIMMRIDREDIRSIRSMGFDFAKVLVNPEPLLADGRMSEAGRGYLKELVGTVVDGGLPAVVCVHPEWEYKRKVLSHPDEFERFSRFLEDTARLLAAGWGPDKLALQLMTEPGGNEMRWNELQPRLWRVARRAMPRHTLILAGDQTGKLEGLLATEPVDDENVLYSFTFYDPFLLTLQGSDWLTPEWWSSLGGVPYPASPEAVREALPAILARIPASPPEWRFEVERRLVAYGEERWDTGRIAARIGRLAEWNRAHGGRRRIWCAEFGCYQRSIDPEARYRYLEDVRRAFEAYGIGWAYWSYNETFTVMSAGRQPFGPAAEQTPDGKLLDALLGADRPR